MERGQNAIKALQLRNPARPGPSNRGTDLSLNLILKANFLYEIFCEHLIYPQDPAGCSQRLHIPKMTLK
jgi:hypothetical protein